MGGMLVASGTGGHHVHERQAVGRRSGAECDGVAVVDRAEPHRDGRVDRVAVHGLAVDVAALRARLVDIDPAVRAVLEAGVDARDAGPIDDDVAVTAATDPNGARRWEHPLATGPAHHHRGVDFGRHPLIRVLSTTPWATARNASASAVAAGGGEAQQRSQVRSRGQAEVGDHVDLADGGSAGHGELRLPGIGGPTVHVGAADFDDAHGAVVGLEMSEARRGDLVDRRRRLHAGRIDGDVGPEGATVGRRRFGRQQHEQYVSARGSGPALGHGDAERRGPGDLRARELDGLLSGHDVVSHRVSP